jgi:hypothetical protein
VLAILGGRSLAAAWDLAVQQVRPIRRGRRPARTGRGQRAGGSGS